MLHEMGTAGQEARCSARSYRKRQGGSHKTCEERVVQEFVGGGGNQTLADGGGLQVNGGLTWRAGWKRVGDLPREGTNFVRTKSTTNSCQILR